MAVPSIVKTYQFASGIVGGVSQIEDCRSFWRVIKDAMIGFGSAPWTVQGSSSSTAAGMDATDRWTTNANLVWAGAGTAHSWIVLRQTGVLSTFEVCIDLVPATTTYQATIIVAPNAFTGGSTTARPTATNERILTTGNIFQASTNPYGYIVIQSTDGSVTRWLFFSSQGYMAYYGSFEVPKNPVSGWTNPWLAGSVSSTVNANTSALFSAAARYVGRVGTTDFTAFLGGEGYNGNLLHTLDRPSGYTGQFPIMPISVISQTVGVRGRLGEIQDCWWISQPSDPQMPILWPDGVSRTHLQFVEMLFPWNGTLPNIFPL